MKRKILLVLSLIVLIAVAVAAGCREKEPCRRRADNEVIHVKGNLKVVYPAAGAAEQAAMDSLIGAFKEAYPDVAVSVEYPEEFPEEPLDLITSMDYFDVICVPQRLVSYYSDNNCLMPLENYCRWVFGLDADNIYEGVSENGIVNGHLCYAPLPQLSGADGGSNGLVVSNRTRYPNASAAFALFFYTPEVPENGTWPYIEWTTD